VEGMVVWKPKQWGKKVTPTPLVPAITTKTGC
jgi:hypothetical protein